MSSAIEDHDAFSRHAIPSNLNVQRQYSKFIKSRY